MNSKISRRDFLKLAALLPLANSKLVQSLNSSAAQPGETVQPNILIIVFDALSARHMSVYGYPRETTPNINRFGQRATVFHNHYSGGSFTSPGTASLLTGALPWRHRAFNIQGTVTDKFIPRNIFNLTPPGTYTISYSQNTFAITLLYQFRAHLDELGMPRKLALQDLEYSDLIFQNDYNISFAGEKVILRGDKQVAGSLFLSFLYRLINQIQTKQLNTQYKPQFPRGVPQPNEVFFILEDSINWAIEQIKTMPQPYMAYFHFIPPHDPYLTRKDFNNLFIDNYSLPEKPESFASDGLSQKTLDINRRRYDRYLAYADAEFGRLVNAMEQNGSFENTCLMLTSDHGELFERGILGHSTPVFYDPLVHIPLIISRPGINTHQDVFELTSCIDVLPTIQSIYGQLVPEWCEGQILPTFQGQSYSGERTILSMDSKGSPKHGAITSGSFMAMQEDYKLVHYMGDLGKDELYNLAKDPEELENLIMTQQPTAAKLLEQIIQKVNQPMA